MNTNPFSSPDESDARRTQAQKELAEVRNCREQLRNGFQNFTDEQRALIEKTFSPSDWEEIRRVYQQAWNTVAIRTVLADEKARRAQLGYPESNTEPAMK